MVRVKKHRAVILLWLSLCASLVVGMVLVGGYTRLSGSGLSITEWKPIHGVIPPRNQKEWEEEFAKYREIPQYSEINKGMSLDEFKTIFWPEYWHRVLGRAIGIVFFFPLVVFWLSGSITKGFGIRLTLIFALGGLQGLMGWYMVASGLMENIYVSHLRLAAHLTLALLLFGLLMWERESVTVEGTPRRQKVMHTFFPGSIALKPAFHFWFLLLCLQIIYGAFMAGLHAGLLYNTYPTMDGVFVPDGLWEPSLGLINLFENRTTVQFTHRNLAILVAVGFGFWWHLFRHHVSNNALNSHARNIALVIALQFILGVMTLLHAVPLALGMAHQITAVWLLGLSVIMMHRLGKT